MTRGRKSQPDEIKELRGNPGKRRLLALEDAKKQRRRLPAPLPKIETPAWLDERQAAIFRMVVDEFQQNRIARGTDASAYGRWATYMAEWIDAKVQLGTGGRFYKIVSNHGERMALHPLFQVMVKCEAMIVKLEADLGLNPAARQNIIRGMSNLTPGDLFGKTLVSETDEDIEDDIDNPNGIETPLSFLQGPSKPN